MIIPELRVLVLIKRHVGSGNEIGRQLKFHVPCAQLRSRDPFGQRRGARPPGQDQHQKRMKKGTPGDVHSGQMTGHARDLSTSGDHFWSLSRFITQIKFPRLTSATRTILVLSPIILPLETFFSRVLMLRQQAFSSGNLPPERPTTTTTAIKTQVFMFRYERVNSTRKFTIVAEIVSVLKKIYERYVPFRAVF